MMIGLKSYGGKIEGGGQSANPYVSSNYCIRLMAVFPRGLGLANYLTCFSSTSSGREPLGLVEWSFYEPCVLFATQLSLSNY